MGCISANLHMASHVRLGLEVLEGRLPVSETIGVGLAVTTLSSISAALIQSRAVHTTRWSAPATPSGQQPAPAGAIPGSILAANRSSASSSAGSAETVLPARPVQLFGSSTAVQPFDDLTQAGLDVFGPAPGARPARARVNSASDTSRAAADAVPARVDSAAASMVGTSTPVSITNPQGRSADFSQPALASLVALGKPLAVNVAAIDTLMFHGNRARTGWNSSESVLTPASVSAHLGLVWSSPQLDSVTLDNTVYPPHLYASPLYVDRVHITSGPYAGSTYGTVFAATTTGFVYAIKAFDTAGPTNIAAGTILWSKSLGQPTPTLDGGVTVGILGTPAIDLSSNRLYVAADVTDSSGRNWKVFALDLRSGDIVSGWPLTINNATLAPINQNGPTTFEPANQMSQRGGLNLSPDGRLLYVPFGAYNDAAAGWLIAVDTRTPALASAFAGAPTNLPVASAGMWGSGGPAVDANGIVLDTTGNSPSGSDDTPGYWGDSYLQWNPGTPLQLNGTYTPWNYSQMDDNDTDLGGGSPIVFDLDPASTSTPHLAAFGGKQGNAYLVDRNNLKGRLDQRPPPSTDSSTDTSLLPPGNQPQFGQPGPLNIFGPYSEASNQVNYAKARTTPAYFQGQDGTSYVVYAGTAKAGVFSTTPVAPSLVLTKIVTAPGQPAYLAVAQQDNLVMKLPGAPVISSNGTAQPIVWVVDANVMRADSLTSPTTPHPILYAFDALTLEPLWSSAWSELFVGGKYVQPTIARGMAFVGTDRIQAFGLSDHTIIDDAVQGTGPNQINYVGRWNHVGGVSVIGSFDGTLSFSDTADDYATISFTGTQIKLYTAETNSGGIAAVSVDGSPETYVDNYGAPNAGDVLVYSSPTLPPGSHTLEIRNTGTHGPNNTGTQVGIDRLEIVP